MKTSDSKASDSSEVNEANNEVDPGGEVSGLVRRVRRRARLSQRELAHELGVSQSAVAKWETGRRSPTARMLARVLEVADLRLAAVGPDGERVRPMRSVAARDAAGRRYPAHAFVRTQGWWAPTGAESTAWIGPIQARSCDLGLPRVRYGRWWELRREPTLADLDDHPTWPQLVAEARAGREPRHRTPFHIPEWVLVDTHRSRNRRPEDFRGPPPRIGTVPSRPRDG